MERLGAFEVGQELSRGGFGVVYDATHRNGTPAAVKLLKNLDPEAIQHEVLAVARLDHANIVAVFDQGTLGPDSSLGPEGTPYFIMERCSGGSLGKIGGRRDWDWTRTMLVQLLEALAHAHAHDVIHLDIKPGNILFAEAEDARPGLKLVDFGISLTQGKGTAAYGTPTYMAPEQYDDHSEVGPWTDLYALGIVAWMTISGPPFEKKGPQTLLEKCADRLVPFAPQFPVPSGLEPWLRTLLRGDWRARYLTAAAALQALHAIDEDAQGFAAAATPDETLTEIAPVAIPNLADRFQPAPGARIPLAMPESTTHAPIALQETGLALLGLREPPFVGRQAVCGALWDRWLEARSDGTRVLLTGLPGVGRRRCLRWLRHQAHAHAGACAPSLLDLHPLHPARDLLCRALSIPTVDLEPARARLVALGAYNERVAIALDELFTTEDGEVAPVLAGRVLGALSRRVPVVLCFPDLASDSAWLTLSATLDEPITWVFSGPETLDGATEIAVEPLPLEAMATSLREWLPFDPTSVDDLVRAANGFPGVLTELVRQAVATDALRPGPRGWALEPSFDLGGGFAARIDRAEREIVSIAAWLGPWCERERLREVVGHDPRSVVQRLVRSGIWRQAGRRLQFTDPRYRVEAETWAVDPPLLSRIAETLAALGDPRRASRAYLQAGQVGRSLHQTVTDLRLNERRHQRTRAHTVREALERARDLPLTEALQGQLWIAEARCLWESGDRDAEKRLHEIYRAGTRHGWHEVAGVASQFLRLIGQSELSTALEIGAFSHMPKGKQRDRRLAIAYRDIALTTSDADEKRDALVRSLTHLEHEETRYDYLYGLCELQMCDGLVDEAVRTAQEAIDLARRVQPDRLTNALVHLCSVLLDAKRFGPAVTACASAAARARMLGAAPALMISLGNQSLALANLGRWQEASQVASQALRYTGYPTFAAVLRALIGTQAARTGDWPLVAQVVTEAEAIGAGFAILGWDATWSLGALAMACGERPDLEERVVGVLARIREQSAGELSPQ